MGSALLRAPQRHRAQLRLLLVLPAAGGLGLGALLTDTCIAHARSQGYASLVLWTNANLITARNIYAKRGFKLVSSEAYRAYGHDLVGEQWELLL